MLVQYKILEPFRSASGTDWIYRPDEQLDEEIARMDRFRKSPQASSSGYKLNPEAFYMRFVKRDAKASSLAISMPIDHFKQVMVGAPKGPRGGIPISYDALNGQYMREVGLVDLVKAGYIGCQCETTVAFETLIEEILQSGNAAVAAIQSAIADYR